MGAAPKRGSTPPVSKDWPPGPLPLALLYVWSWAIDPAAPRDYAALFPPVASGLLSSTKAFYKKDLIRHPRSRWQDWECFCLPRGIEESGLDPGDGKRDGGDSY